MDDFGDDNYGASYTFLNERQEVIPEDDPELPELLDGMNNQSTFSYDNVLNQAVGRINPPLDSARQSVHCQRVLQQVASDKRPYN